MNGDFVEGTEADAQKEYADQFKPHTAVTLRVTKPYHYKNKIVVGDAYFGSLSTAIALAQVGTYCVMNVKLASQGFPKEQIKEKIDERGKQAHFRLSYTLDHPPIGFPYIYGSGHCDI